MPTINEMIIEMEEERRRMLIRNKLSNYEDEGGPLMIKVEVEYIVSHILTSYEVPHQKHIDDYIEEIDEIRLIYQYREVNSKNTIMSLGVVTNQFHIKKIQKPDIEYKLEVENEILDYNIDYDNFEVIYNDGSEDVESLLLANQI